jgi:hypothetical protein
MRAPDFYPDKSEGGDSRFVQIVAKPGRKAEPKLTRVAFETSRLMEFCSLRELQNQTGHAWSDWPLVVLKELVDNALDACEESEIAPVISVGVEPGSITIADNGRGIEASTIKGILDYSIRVPSREAYVSPTRGAQGNALKTILAMGYVLNREIFREDEPVGLTVIEARGERHEIRFRVDHVSNEPKLEHKITPSPVISGTRIEVAWPKQWEWQTYYGGLNRFCELVEHYAWPAFDSARRGVRKSLRQSRRHRSGVGEMEAAQSNVCALVQRGPTATLSCCACCVGPEAWPTSHRSRLYFRISWPVPKRRPARGAAGGRLLAPVAGTVLRRE